MICIYEANVTDWHLSRIFSFSKHVFPYLRFSLLKAKMPPCVDTPITIRSYMAKRWIFCVVCRFILSELSCVSS